MSGKDWGFRRRKFFLQAVAIGRLNLVKRISPLWQRGKEGVQMFLNCTRPPQVDRKVYLLRHLLDGEAGLGEGNLACVEAEAVGHFPSGNQLSVLL